MGIENKITDLGSSITIKIAEKKISLSEFRDYGNGISIDFHKSVYDEVDLLLHDKPYGKAKLIVKDNIVYLKMTKIYE